MSRPLARASARRSPTVLFVPWQRGFAHQVWPEEKRNLLVTKLAGRQLSQQVPGHWRLAEAAGRGLPARSVRFAIIKTKPLESGSVCRVTVRPSGESVMLRIITPPE